MKWTFCILVTAIVCLSILFVVVFAGGGSYTAAYAAEAPALDGEFASGSNPEPTPTPTPAPAIPSGSNAESVGDVNGDGKVDELDAAMILRGVVGRAGRLETVRADVDGDRAITPLDAARLLKK